jgi:hypothetical protein
LNEFKKKGSSGKDYGKKEVSQIHFIEEAILSYAKNNNNPLGMQIHIFVKVGGG